MLMSSRYVKRFFICLSLKIFEGSSSVLRPLMFIGANGVVVAEEANDCTLYNKYMAMSSSCVVDMTQIQVNLLHLPYYLRLQYAITMGQGGLYDLQSFLCVWRAGRSRNGCCNHVHRNHSGFRCSWLRSGCGSTLHNMYLAPASVRAGFNFCS